MPQNHRLSNNVISTVHMITVILSASILVLFSKLLFSIFSILFSKWVCLSAYNLIENYLTNRQQQVKIGNTNSKLLPMCIGVPQGLILGPLLFSMYINDLLKTCPKLNCIMYADDTTLYGFLENFESNDVEREING